MMSLGSRDRRRPRGRWLAACVVIIMGASLGTASASVAVRDDGSRLVDVLTRELGLTRSATEIRDAMGTLEREQRSMRYTAAVLEHAAGESMRRWLAYQEVEQERDAVARHRARALYKLAHGGAARLIFEGDPDERLARVTQGRALRRVVLHELEELSVYRRSSERATAELASAVRERQALSAVAQLQPMQAQVLRIATRELAPVLASAHAESSRETRTATGASRRAHAELADDLQRARQALRERHPLLARPVPGPVVGSFGAYVDPVLNLPMSRDGIELRAPVRAQVRALAAGRVVLVSPMPGFGEVVAIDHGDGRFSLTGRLWQIAVEAGQTIDRGDVIGRVAPKAQDDGLGSTVYVELRDGERPVDPAPLIAPR
jgi:murein hydrolase activator